MMIMRDSSGAMRARGNGIHTLKSPRRIVPRWNELVSNFFGFARTATIRLWIRLARRSLLTYRAQDSQEILREGFVENIGVAGF